MKAINIVGAGLAGSIMAKLLRNEGIAFTIFDSREPGAASQVSENLIGLNWYADQAERRDQAIEILKTIAPHRYVGMKGEKIALQYDRNLILEKAVKLHVTPVIGGVVDDAGKLYEGFNIICLGVWDKTIGVRTLVGLGMEFEGQSKTEFIKPHLPYRQQKLINVSSDKYWYSQSLAVTDLTYRSKNGMYKDQLIREAINQGIIKDEFEPFDFKFGYRPRRFEHENVWDGKTSVRINGGFKSGLINYPIQCKKVLDFIKKNNL